MSDSPKQLSNARVSVVKLNSTGPIEALAVVQMDSTGGIISGGAGGGGSTQVSVRDILTSSGASVMDGANNAINVNVVAGAAAGSTYVSVRQSTAADLNAAVVQGSTVWQVQVSTVQGQVRVAPASTLWASSAGFHFNSSGDLQTVGPVSSLAGRVGIAGFHTADGVTDVTDSTNAALRVNVVAGAAGGSTEVTIRQSTFTDLNCRINAPSTANSSNYLPVRITDGSSFISPGNEYTDASTYSSLAGPTLTYNNSSNNTYRAVGISQPWPVQHRTSSGASMDDSTNNALRVNVVAGAAAGSTEVTIRQSTAADLNATVIQGSTVWPVQVSSVAGAVVVRSSAANALFTAYQSTAADFNATVTLASSANSVLARVTTSSGGGVEGSTVTASGNVLGLNVRPVFPTMLSTTVVITSTNSTAIYPLVSSAAAPLRHKVFAYFVGSTHTSPSTLIFCSSASASGFDHFAVNFGSGSSGVTGANLAVAPPGFIFAGIANNALNVKVEGGSSAASTVIVRVSISYFTEA